MGPSYVLLLINDRWFRWYNDFAVRLWLVLPGAFFELVFGCKIVITGDKISDNDSPLIIMNHRCRLDWMFYWMALLRYGRLANEKIIMKQELKFIPGPGWCMQNLMYFFLLRRWEQDESYLDRILNYFIDMNYPLQLFLFPEGTDLCKESLESSHKYAEKTGLVKYEYCLHPRVKGFHYLVQKLRGNILDTVHDVTIGYPVNLCYGEIDLLQGNFPKEIHILIKRYKMKDMPATSDELDEWCIERWAEKESRLKKFYEDGKFIEGGDEVYDKSIEEKVKAVMFFIFAFWTIFLVLVAYSLWFYSVARWYCFLMVVFYSILSVRGGTDAFQLGVRDWLNERNKKT